MLKIWKKRLYEFMADLKTRILMQLGNVLSILTQIQVLKKILGKIREWRAHLFNVN